MLSGIIADNGISGKFLQLLWVVKTSNVTYLCHKSTHRSDTYSFDLQQRVNIWYLCQSSFDRLHQIIHPFAVHFIIVKQKP